MENIFNTFEIIKLEKLEEYKYAGVWAMFGIRKENNPQNKYTCLNVGKNICIGEELEIDFLRLKGLKKPNNKKEYRNQFNKYKFIYEEHPTRLDYLYDDIYQKYKNIVAIIVTKQTENTHIIEKYFAYCTKAEYWVSNGRYSSKTIVNDLEIERIRKGIDISVIDESIIKQIDEFKDVYEQQ